MHSDIVSAISEFLRCETMVGIEDGPLCFVHIGFWVHGSSVEENDRRFIRHFGDVDEIVLHLHLEVDQVGL